MDAKDILIWIVAIICMLQGLGRLGLAIYDLRKRQARQKALREAEK